MKPLKKITLKALSSINLNIKKNYRLYRKVQRIITTPLKPDYETLDDKIMVGEREIPVRVFSPPGIEMSKVLIFFHGGGWVTGDIDTYTPICSALADSCRQTVISVDYRLAPEYPFPKGLIDCYIATKAIFLEADKLGIHPDDITLIGDSAGGNLAAAVSILAAKKKEFFPKKQILIYPATYHDHSQSSPFASVTENGEDYILTARRIEDYMDLYVPVKKERLNPFVAPLLSENLNDQPNTLLITAEFDPLRDEGDAYGMKLKEFGNSVRAFCIKGAIHGFLGNPLAIEEIKKTHELIKIFLNEPLQEGRVKNERTEEIQME